MKNKLKDNIFYRFVKENPPQEFYIVTYHFQLLYHLSISKFIEQVNKFLVKAYFLNLYMLSCDFTTDLGIGFCETFLWDLLKMRCFHRDRQAQFSMKAMLKEDKNDKSNYTISLYNKFVYNVMIYGLKPQQASSLTASSTITINMSSNNYNKIKKKE